LNSPTVTTEEFITVGQLGRPRGTAGEIYVTPLTDFPERFLNMQEIFVSSGESWSKMRIESSKIASGRPVLKFSGISNPEEASRLTSRYLAVPKSEIVKPPENSFYIFDLVGCEVYDRETDRRVGVILDVEEYPANDVYVIKTDEGKILNLAAVRQFVKSVDIENKKVVNDSSGLIE